MAEEKKSFNCLHLWAGLGVFHYGPAVVGWLMSVFLLLHTGGDREGWNYVAVRMIPCLIMLAAFVVALVLARRKTPFVKLLLAVATTITILWFGFDAYRHDYQIQAMTDRGCDHYYTTWWWYNDRWDPNR